jgi:hypothetical protein
VCSACGETFQGTWYHNHREQCPKRK